MEGGNGLPTIKREQIVSMNQHYRRFSLDYYLECQEKLGVENIEFWPVSYTHLTLPTIA